MLARSGSRRTVAALQGLARGSGTKWASGQAAAAAGDASRHPGPVSGPGGAAAPAPPSGGALGGVRGLGTQRSSIADPVYFRHQGEPADYLASGAAAHWPLDAHPTGAWAAGSAGRVA